MNIKQALALRGISDADFPRLLRQQLRRHSPKWHKRPNHWRSFLQLKHLLP